jgi:hypothetical protein
VARFLDTASRVNGCIRKLATRPSHNKEFDVSLRRTWIVVAAAAIALAGVVGSVGAAPAQASEKAASQAAVANPYARVVWDKVEFVHSFSHEHGRDPQVFWDMGFRHLPLSNYYPSRPVYPLPDAFLQKHPDACGAPNAEHHSMTDSGYHFCTPGSFYTVGYGQTPRIKAGASPIEHVFSGLNVFDAEKSPWLGVYRLDLRMAAQPGAGKTPTVSLTVEGASEVRHKTFAPVGDGQVRSQRRTAKSPESIYLKTESDTLRVRLDFDPASTRITRLRLMQGTNRPWRDAFRAALDGTLKDAAGRPTEGLLFPDGGGITINHPGGRVEPLLEKLDFDSRVLGIEVWNQHEGFGGPKMGFYRLWDEALRSRRRCFGFFVKDHVVHGRGRNVLLVANNPNATRLEREHEALRAYREGRFFGLVAALATDASGKIVAPYDRSEFRFTRIAVKEDGAGQPLGVEVSVDGADRSKRPNTQIRFVTESGVAQVANGDHACFTFPRNPAGGVGGRYVRIEAFAYPSTHMGGQPLTAKAISAMNVHEISRIYDRLGTLEMSNLDTPGRAPLPIVDMLFSQPILLRTGD